MTGRGVLRAGRKVSSAGMASNKSSGVPGW
jgi:hypothetical protein